MRKEVGRGVGGEGAGCLGRGDEMIDELRESYPPDMWEGLPTDLAKNKKHYLYGPLAPGLGRGVMQRRAVFADAGYWIAIMYPDDQLHKQARRMASRLVSVQIVTTQMVLTEAATQKLGSCRNSGEFRRRFASEMVQRLQLPG